MPDFRDVQKQNTELSFCRFLNVQLLIFHSSVAANLSCLFTIMGENCLAEGSVYFQRQQKFSVRVLF